MSLSNVEKTNAHTDTDIQMYTADTHEKRNEKIQ